MSQTKARLSSFLMRRAVGNRHGLVLRPQQAPLSQSDVASIIHFGVPRSLSQPWSSAAGGVGRDRETSELAAIGEAIERAASAQVKLDLKPRSDLEQAQRVDAEEFALFTPKQRSQDGFVHTKIYDQKCPYVEVFSLQDNSSRWAPQPFVSLQDDFATGIPTSSGLAAAPTAQKALLRGIQELIERDALMVTWLHGLPGRRVKSLAGHIDEIEQLNGDMVTFDLTPKYSPFPVAAVMGGIKKQGKWRYSLGVACRETWAEAAEKAYLEWNQGVIFYSLYPEHWHELPIWGDETIHKVKNYASFKSDSQALAAAKKALKNANIRLYYRDITTIDALQAGERVVKALSPDMAMIFAHQEWPFLAKVESMAASHYPDLASRSTFPNLMPHPLG
ncbi:hypothetical protein CR969_02775 [Candidatus Saccharibacteria bacterium]|nr:MAG: hypothetical protein CR969_02775 [Candidatus Saccharibacteria bacterium]